MKQRLGRLLLAIVACLLASIDNGSIGASAALSHERLLRSRVHLDSHPDDSPSMLAQRIATGLKSSAAGEAGPSSMTFARDSLFVIDDSDSCLYKLPAEHGRVDHGAAKELKQPLACYGTNPGGFGYEGVTTDLEGRLYISQKRPGQIFEVSPEDGQVLRTVVEGIAGAKAVVGDPRGGGLYVAHDDGGISYVANPASSAPQLEPFSTLDRDVQSLSVSDDGMLYASTKKDVFWFRFSTRKQRRLHREKPNRLSLELFGDVRGVSVTHKNTALVINYRDGRMSRYKLNSKKQMPILVAGNEGYSPRCVIIGMDDCVYVNRNGVIVKLIRKDGTCGEEEPEEPEEQRFKKFDKYKRDKAEEELRKSVKNIQIRQRKLREKKDRLEKERIEIQETKLKKDRLKESEIKRKAAQHDLRQNQKEEEAAKKDDAEAKKDAIAAAEHKKMKKFLENEYKARKTIKALQNKAKAARLKLHRRKLTELQKAKKEAEQQAKDREQKRLLKIERRRARLEQALKTKKHKQFQIAEADRKRKRAARLKAGRKLIQEDKVRRKRQALLRRMLIERRRRKQKRLRMLARIKAAQAKMKLAMDRRFNRVESIKQRANFFHRRLHPSPCWGSFRNVEYLHAKAETHESMCILSGIVKRNPRCRRKYISFMMVLAPECRPVGGRISFSVIKNRMESDYERVYWPKTRNRFGEARIDILPNGQVFYMGYVAPPNTVPQPDPLWVSLDGIRFSTSSAHAKPLQLLNNWESWGHGYGEATEIQIGNICLLSGLIFNGLGFHRANVSSKCRPADGTVFFSVDSHEGITRLDIQASGEVKRQGGYFYEKELPVSLDGITYSVVEGTLLPLLNGWGPYIVGPTFRRPQWRKEGNLCILSGVATQYYSLNFREHITTLPRDCRPRGRLVFGANVHMNNARVDVFPNGEVRYILGQNPGWNFLSLSNIMFLTPEKPSRGRLLAILRKKKLKTQAAHRHKRHKRR